ncbi:MAG: hypothetical protein ACO3F2_04650 [Roseiflexaceae bacterium]|jgi:hypothetical protein
MASKKAHSEPSVSRTYRAAVKIGEDYVTIEETITLDMDATDEQIAQSVELGWRIFKAQQDSAKAQILEARESYGDDRERIALPSQLERISDLQRLLGWDAQQLSDFLAERRLDGSKLSRRQASLVVDQLRRLIDEQQRDAAPAHASQIEAIRRKAGELHVEVEVAIAKVIGEHATIDTLTYGEANQLFQRMQSGRKRTSSK